MHRTQAVKACASLTSGDGISGRTNTVWDEVAGNTAIGRFGWKANVASVRQQTAGAFSGDVGITSPVFPDADCPVAPPP